MKKYYRVKKDNFLWEKGAILEHESGNGSKGGYYPIEPIWDKTEYNDREYISSPIVENSPEWFERVYKVDLLKKAAFYTKDKAKELLDKQFNN